MSPEEELQKFKDGYPQRLERARKTALTFGILAITALIAFVYAFFQQEAGQRNQMLHELNMQYMAQKLKAAEVKAMKFETLATSDAARGREISEQCQRNRTTPK